MVIGYIIQIHLRNCSRISDFGTDFENFISLWQRKRTRNIQWSDFQRCWTSAALHISIAVFQGLTRLRICSLSTICFFY